MRKLIEALSVVIPFLNPYPFWVKALISVWILLSAAILLALLFTYPKPSQPTPKSSHEDHISGDKIINYGTFIKIEAAKVNKSNIVTEETIRDFFSRFQLGLSKIRGSLSPKELRPLPNYLQMPYDINVTISKCHGVGMEFITPSEKPQINISITEMPIETYYFSKYTNQKDYSKSKIFRVRTDYLVLANLILVGGKEVVALEGEAGVVLKNVAFKYSPEDTPRNIEFLWLFGNNQETYWRKNDPTERAKHLFAVK